MKTFSTGLALLSFVWLAFAACGTQSSGGSGGSGGALQCEKIFIIPYDLENPCDPCVQQECCPELFACNKASPFCPWICAAGSEPMATGCDTVYDVAQALRQCWTTKCACLCGGSPSKCDAGADMDSSGSGGSGGASSSTSSGSGA
jgi:hypothetical protein